MFAYESLARCPGAFRSLTGMTPAEFETLLTAFGEAQDRLRRGRRTTRRGEPRRRRGRPPPPPRRPPPPPPGARLAPHLPHLRTARLLLRPAQAQRPTQRPRRPRRPGHDRRLPLRPPRPRPQETPLRRRGHGRVPAGPSHHRRQGAAGEPADGVRGPEALLLREEEGPHGQDAGGGGPVRADRGGQRLGPGRGQPRPAAVVRLGGAGAVGAGRGGDGR